MRTRASARITTILTYILATLVIFQGVMMLLPATAVRTARELILKDRRRRKHEVELAQVFPDVWVRHIRKTEEKTHMVGYRTLD
jgi:hypothetical protein